MNIRYSIELQDEQRQLLEKITSSGIYSARQIKRAQILLKSDRVTHWSYAQLIEAFDVLSVSIAHVRNTFVEQGLRGNRVLQMVMSGATLTQVVAVERS